jgi:hypothetical protein
MTIGRNNEAPAAYALTSTIKRLLDHLIESQLYSEKDLSHIQQTLGNLTGIISNGEGAHSPRLITLLANRLTVCEKACEDLQLQLQRLDPGLADVHEKLISILRNISLVNTKSKVRNLSGFVNRSNQALVLKLRSQEIQGPSEGDSSRTG